MAGGGGRWPRPVAQDRDAETVTGGLVLWSPTSCAQVPWGGLHGDTSGCHSAPRGARGLGAGGHGRRSPRVRGPHWHRPPTSEVTSVCTESEGGLVHWRTVRGAPRRGPPRNGSNEATAGPALSQDTRRTLPGDAGLCTLPSRCPLLGGPSPWGPTGALPLRSRRHRTRHSRNTSEVRACGQPERQGTKQDSAPEGRARRGRPAPRRCLGGRRGQPCAWGTSSGDKHTTARSLSVLCSRRLSSDRLCVPKGRVRAGSGQETRQLPG